MSNSRGTKRPNIVDQTANINAAKRIKIQREKELFRELHGESYNISIFKRSHAKLTDSDVNKLKTDLAVHQVINNININSTKAFYNPKARCYIIRVHTVEERLAIHKIVTEIFPQYTTFCSHDTTNLSKIVMRVPPDFPEVLLNVDQLGKLVNQTIGNLVGKAVSNVQLYLPPCEVEEGFNRRIKLKLDIGVDCETYNALLAKQQLLSKTDKLTAFLLTYSVSISIPPAFSSTKPTELTALEKTAIAAQNCMTAAKQAKKICLEAAHASNQASMDNLSVDTMDRE